MPDEVTTVTIEPGEQPKVDATKPAKPDGIPDKFWDAEKGQVRVDDLAKSYTELEKARTKPTEKPPEATKETLDPGTNLAVTPDQKKKLDDAGLDLSAITKEYSENGKLSDETYKRLEGAKLPKAVVDGYIEGQKAIAARTQAEVFDSVGGKDAYASAVAWARDNLPADEIKAYDEGLKGKSLAELKVAAKGLIARAKSEGGNTPNLVLGGDAGGGLQPYSSMNELVADQRKPEYKNSPAFREKVKARIAISPNL